MDEAFNINTEYLTDAELEQLSKHLDKYKELHERDKLQGEFLEFVRHVWPSFMAAVTIRFLLRSAFAEVS